MFPSITRRATIFLALVEKCRSADKRDQHFEFVDKARSIVVELGWFVWNRSHLVYIIETMCAIATAKYLDEAAEDLGLEVVRRGSNRATLRKKGPSVYIA